MLYFHELEVNCSELFHHLASVCVYLLIICLDISTGITILSCIHEFLSLILFCTSFSSSDVIDKGLSSAVTSSEHPELTMSLQLLGGDSTFNQPEQHWQFESNVAVTVFLVEKI